MAEKKTQPKKSQRLPVKEAAKRNLAIVAYKLANPNATFTHLAEVFELTDRQVKNIWYEWAKEDQQAFATADQVELVHEQLAGFRALRGELHQVFLDAGDNHAARVGALKAIAELRQREIELLQAVGRLPKNLGQLEVLLDVRHTSEVFLLWGNKWVLDKLPAKEKRQAILELDEVLKEALPQPLAGEAAKN